MNTMSPWKMVKMGLMPSPNTEELPPIIQDMLDQGGATLTMMTSLVHWQLSP